VSRRDLISELGKVMGELLRSGRAIAGSKESIRIRPDTEILKMGERKEKRNISWGGEVC